MLVNLKLDFHNKFIEYLGQYEFDLKVATFIIVDEIVNICRFNDNELFACQGFSWIDMIHLEKGAQENARLAVVNATFSNVNIPSKAKKPNILLVSKWK